MWCNAYSEMTGKTPVYYIDGYTTVLKTSTTDDWYSTINSGALQRGPIRGLAA
ncbi:MAG: hypothetical protein LBD20_07315 [Spirochaetaceae bacterium]|nr:hypothetical protein [Spirochaetaceae bacterium]